MIIDAKNMPYAELNKMIRDSDEQKFTLENVLGQRYIGAGLSGKEILIKGTPGNALGAYLNGAKISVHGNAQDATGDTMNDGAIIIHGNSGDTTGYAMRSGEICSRPSLSAARSATSSASTRRAVSSSCLVSALRAAR